MNENKYIEVGGRLHSIATGNILLGANEVFDDDKNKKQNDINTETYSLVNNINERLNSLSPDQQSALNVATKATNNETKLGYYVCDTENNVAAKVISNATGYILSNGGSIKIKMTNANTANDATLNINSTGPKPLYYDGERVSANNSWMAGETVEVYYDGTSYYANNVTGSSGSGDDAFDVSVKYPTSGIEGGNTYTLQGALAVLNTNLSANKKKGGMSIKFVQSSDNKYVQYRYTGTAVIGNPNPFLETANWQGVDDKPTAGSNNLVKSGGVKLASNYNTTRNVGLLPSQLVSGYIQAASTIWPKTGLSFIIPIKNGDVIHITAGDRDAGVALSTTDPSITGSLSWMTGFDGRINITAKQSYTAPVSQDGFLVINHTVTSGVVVPAAVDINDYTLLPAVGYMSLENKKEISNIQGNIGSINVKDMTPMQLSWANGGGRGAVGSTFSVTTSTAYRNTYISVVYGREYYIKTRTSDSVNYPAYVFWLDGDAKILRREVNPGIVGYVATKLVVPEGAVQMNLTCFGDNSIAATCYISDTVELYDLQSQINGDGEIEVTRSFIDISALESKRNSDAYIDISLSSFESGIINTAMDKVTALNGDLNFVLVTDTHQGGRYLERNLSSFRSISIANKILGKSAISFLVHAGDVSCDYGLQRQSYLNYLSDTIGRLTRNPKLIAKGNHDANVDRYVLAPRPYNFKTNIYYLLSGISTYTEVSESEYDGVSPLYLYATSNADVLISDKEFLKLVPLPSSAVIDENNPTGGYYYIDIGDFRMIVLNNYMITDNHEIAYSSTPTGQQFAWLSKIALQTSKKVIIFGHMSVSDFSEDNKAAMNTILSAFIEGTSVSGTIYDVDYSATFSNAGNFVGYIHGHSHADTYDNTDGYNNIGVNASFRNLDLIGQESDYVVSIYTVTATALYETRIGVWSDAQRTVDRSFSWPTPSELT